tara:strand:- start:275 stop:487 length:213 start_codon:yes stop_codon:yes gene_type:complete
MKTVIESATKLRCKKLAWMRGKEWKWHIVFTDHMSVLLPKKTPLYSYFNKQVLTAMGFDELDNESNGPND